MYGLLSCETFVDDSDTEAYRQYLMLWRECLHFLMHGMFWWRKKVSFCKRTENFVSPLLTRLKAPHQYY